MYTEIARNKRRSVIFVCAFFVTWLGIGALLGLLAWELSRPSLRAEALSMHSSATPSAWTLLLIGLLVGGGLALAGIIYSLVAGAKLVLRVSGAEPAPKNEYQVLYDVVETLAIGEGIPTPAVYVIKDPSPNAFATGLGPGQASITYTTGLLELMNREELEGVTSHELSHIKNHDIRLLLLVGTLIGLAALLASVLWRGAFYGSVLGGGEDNEGGGAVLLFVIAAGTLLAVIGFIVGPLIRLALSRRREALADADGVELTRNPVGLLSALKKLEKNDIPFKSMNHATAAMCIDDPLQHHEAWYHRLYDTHPPIAERIAQLEKIAAGVSV